MKGYLKFETGGNGITEVTTALEDVTNVDRALLLNLFCQTLEIEDDELFLLVILGKAAQKHSDRTEVKFDSEAAMRGGEEE